MASACGLHLHVLMVTLLLSCNIGAMAGSWAGSGVYDGAGRWGSYYGGGGGDMVGEAARRVLDDTTTTTYISYSALTADAVPCSTAGASYYDCAASDAVNPYTRSCTTITLCARDTS